MAVVPTKITINGKGPDQLDVQARRPFEIPFQRGTEAGTFDIVLDEAQIGKLRGLIRPGEQVDFRIECAGPDGNKAPLEIRNWYVKRIKQLGDGAWSVTFADCRWPLSYGKFTGAFNVKTYGGLWRFGTVVGGRPWNCLNAAQEVIRIMGGGLGVEIDPAVVAHDTELPSNLGNSEGGLWHNARLAEILPLFLEPIRADLTVTADGRLLITDRETAPAAAIRTAAYQQAIGTTDRSWQRPKRINVTFRMRVERRFDIGTTTATSDDIQVVNVVEDFDPADPAAVPAEPYPVLTDVLSRELGLGEQDLLQRFLKPTMVPVTSATTAAQLLRRSAFESQIRRAWRRLWKYADSPDSQAGRARAIMAGIRFGRLKADGTTDPKGVYAHWTERRRVAHKDAAGTPQWSLNHPATGLGEPEVAPFVARWVDEGAGVFVIEDAALPLMVGAAHIGHLSIPPRMVPIANLKDPAARVAFEEHGVFRQRFRGYVYYNAILVGAGPARLQGNPELAGPLHIEKRDGFADGGLESVTIPVEGTLANFGWDTALSWPGLPLNAAEIAAFADQIAERVKQSYADGEAGTVLCAGVAAPAAAGLTKGAVHYSAIIVGADAPWSVTTRYDVLPEVRSTARPELAAFDPRELL